MNATTVYVSVVWPASVAKERMNSREAAQALSAPPAEL
jgi:hypothetical protein